MILSMTGYGAGIASSDSFRVTAELKSLNSKYMEVTLKLPKVYLKYEHEIRSMLGRRLGRGKVVALLNIEVLTDKVQRININRSLAKSYLKELNSIKDELNLAGDIDLSFLVNMPEVIPTDIGEENEEEWNLIRQAIELACEKLISSRKVEGEALNKDLAFHVDSIGSSLEKVVELAPRRIERVRERVEKSLDDIRDKVEVDPNRFEQELIFYLEKLDINEEIVRLGQHLKYFKEIQEAPKSNGKKLQFLSQEMGREINTIGSKANDAEIQRLVVNMKNDLEKIKEQVLNIV
ncbi:MAG: YicC/YloC family endoribonuclease [Bacteroidota bacterium]